jgi:hypothetical protein
VRQRTLAGYWLVFLPSQVVLLCGFQSASSIRVAKNTTDLRESDDDFVPHRLTRSHRSERLRIGTRS